MSKRSIVYPLVLGIIANLVSQPIVNRLHTASVHVVNTAYIVVNTVNVQVGPFTK